MAANENMQTDDNKKGKVTNDERNLVVSFIQFLRHKVSSNQCTDEQIEGLEVAIQCLETAFFVSDRNYAFQPSKPLIEIFKAAEGLPDGDQEFPKPTQTDVEKSNALKEEGNELVKSNKFEEAILKYNEAIKLNRDPIFFCNRAAAYCRLEQYDLAIQDCRTALALDPKYAKAYGRMGVALSCQNRYDQAVEAYKKALELDPGNESYKNNLSIAEDKLLKAREALRNNPQPNPFANMFGGPGGMGGLMNNPEMMSTITNIMQDPNMRNMMTQMVQSMGQPGQQNQDQAQAGNPSANAFSEMLRVGEALARSMQESNPDLVEQLRRQFGGEDGNDGGAGAGGNQNNNQQPPPGSV
ncbi:hypothetical protein niasHT_006740 [Heterodera trifolii]|uniref:SGTA homodimerisation domain-containing protein n=1 Tax=Heterodera trifolii TaxID=157864 RepID=A0ABD2LWT0_9BILA